MIRSLLSFTALVALSGPVAAHELWLEPLDYTITRQDTIESEIFNGQGFGGTVDGEVLGATRIGYFPNRIAAARYFLGDASAPVDGRLGTTPALQLAPLAEGLHSIAYVSTPASLTYENWERFQRFVDHKDLDVSLERHLELGFPEEGFGEVYIRNSKTLVAVGDGAGADRRTGMETEIVALDNPYTDDLSEGMRVALYYQGGVRADEQIELFEKDAEGNVVITLVRTDADGIAVLPVRPGFSYMADAVVLRQPSEALAEQSGAVWETLWANLTFAVPAE